MAKTLQDLRDRLRHKVALPSNDQMVPDTDLDISINDGMNAMAADYDWPWLFKGETITTVAGQAAYLLPADHVRTLWVSDDTIGQDLIAKQRRDLTRWIVIQGRPYYYSVYGAGIRFGPKPDAVYTFSHTYLQAEPALVDPTDEPLCPDIYSDLIVLYAAIEEATRLKDFTQRTAFMNDAAAWTAKIKKHVRQEASTLRIKTRQDWPI